MRGNNATAMLKNYKTQTQTRVYPDKIDNKDCSKRTNNVLNTAKKKANANKRIQKKSPASTIKAKQKKDTYKGYVKKYEESVYEKAVR